MHNYLAKFSLRNIFLLLILLLGLLLLLTLVQHQQDLRSRAKPGPGENVEVINALDSEGNKIDCDYFSCTTTSSEILILSIDPTYFPK